VETVGRKSDLTRTFKRVAEELHHQYLLGFTPPKLDGKSHHLAVGVNDETLTVDDHSARRPMENRDIHINIAQVVNAVVRVASKPYIDFIEDLLASGRINALEVEELNQAVHNQRLILVDLAREELSRELHGDPPPE
jgi:hypothetical protein